ncbi:hypothetical protein BDV41DRAFT_531726 [Aspergillus transmontanensis]|uniref:Uncharacterized protein n=1 Tax=Aspergillus transmontanensis TaxID=1034304 RepID=A0A5N6W6A8_9EURO|nr:hypothetical protein BDV41DRAFT_531726 [Aspergillus transmontanensis]
MRDVKFESSQRMRFHDGGTRFYSQRMKRAQRRKCNLQDGGNLGKGADKEGASSGQLSWPLNSSSFPGVWGDPLDWVPSKTATGNIHTLTYIHHQRM